MRVDRMSNFISSVINQTYTNNHKFDCNKKYLVYLSLSYSLQYSSNTLKTNCNRYSLPLCRLSKVTSMITFLLQSVHSSLFDVSIIFMDKNLSDEPLNPCHTTVSILKSMSVLVTGSFYCRLIWPALLLYMNLIITLLITLFIYIYLTIYYLFMILTVLKYLL